MDLSKIMTISGKGGLFTLVAQTKTGAIVESMTDGKRFPVFTHEKMSSLEEISVFTTGEDAALKEVLKKMYEKQEGKAAIDPKSDGAVLRQFFSEVMPDFDQERVYTSDIKKIIAWYNLLIEKNLLDFTEETPEAAATSDTAEGSGEEPTQEAGEDEQSNP
ncbi:MAG TPA: DUF5606 domain-containing protein [Bacteroidales bacterium]|nr:DUF5606 domain-containing protein [Bacteroidales bacterium]HSA43304.1 DUF5606 domain-containing protein [Bacteroidales bacterium]